MRTRFVWMGAGACGLVVAGALLSHHSWQRTRPGSTPLLQGPETAEVASPGADDSCSHDFRMPVGRAPSLTCEGARAIVAQARKQLGYPPAAVEARALADATIDWLDPYGLWSVAPDAPVAASFERGAGALLADLEGNRPLGCREARAIGQLLVEWVSELRGLFDEARRGPPEGEDAMTVASAPAFEGATVTRPARALAATLGRRMGALDRAFGSAVGSYVAMARARYFPALDAEGWEGVVLAAAVRAYVPSVDPHGAWAPLDEESSVYEVDLEARPPTRLWEKGSRTAIGVKIESGALPPLADGDVLLALGGLATAGLSYEQVEQLGYAASEARPPARAELLRRGDMIPRTVWLDGTSVGADGPRRTPDGDELPVERIEYGDQDVIVVTVHDVRDDLGDELTRSILRERVRKGPRSLIGLVLDLRGNGGGSTDGAIDALGLFIPGAPLFPMKRRDGSIETDRAPEPPGVDRWRGPVAALVDGDTASAAEMLAGAIASYRRGPIIGTRTFGKGCAQEYIDDDAHAGVLRLTTLLYALPDGTPVQRVGLVPTIRFPFGIGGDASDREEGLLHAPPVWRGPDVRDRSVLAHAEDGTWSPVWPNHGGNVGPCKDADVCRALRLAGAAAPTARRTSSAKGR